MSSSLFAENAIPMYLIRAEYIVGRTVCTTCVVLHTYYVVPLTHHDCKRQNFCRGVGKTMPPPAPVFGRSVYPTLTKGGRLCSPPFPLHF